VVGLRRDGLQRLVGDFKYNSERGSAKVIVRLLDQTLPNKELNDFTVVPITTVAKNVRYRGFDHMKLVGKRLAKVRRLPFAPDLLSRKNNSTQHNQAGLAARRRNAAESLSINPRVKVPSKILLLDDIYTTGATVETTAKILRRNGAKEIWLVIVARQLSKE
jgi:ComF family protein